MTRLKRGVRYAVRERRSFAPGRGVTSDQTIALTSREGRKKCPILLRRVGYRDAETGKHRVSHQQLPTRAEDHRGHLQGPLAGRALLQVDQAESPDQELSRHFPQRSADAGMDRHVRPPDPSDHPVSGRTRSQTSPNATKSLLAQSLLVTTPKPSLLSCLVAPLEVRPWRHLLLGASSHRAELLLHRRRRGPA